MLANFHRGGFLRNPRTISKFSKRKGESSSCVYVLHKRDILGNLTWKSCGIVKKCTRKCAPRAVLLSHSLSLFYFFDFLRFNSNVCDSKSIEENAQNIRFEIFVVKPDSEPNRLSDQTYTKPILGCVRFGFVLGSLSNDDGDGPTAARTEKKKRFRLAKQQLCTCITLFCTFLAGTATLRRQTS